MNIFDLLSLSQNQWNLALRSPHHHLYRPAYFALNPYPPSMWLWALGLVVEYNYSHKHDQMVHKFKLYSPRNQISTLLHSYHPTNRFIAQHSLYRTHIHLQWDYGSSNMQIVCIDESKRIQRYPIFRSYLPSTKYEPPSVQKYSPQDLSPSTLCIDPISALCAIMGSSIDQVSILSTIASFLLIECMHFGDTWHATNPRQTEPHINPKPITHHNNPISYPWMYVRASIIRVLLITYIFQSVNLSIYHVLVPTFRGRYCTLHATTWIDLVKRSPSLVGLATIFGYCSYRSRQDNSERLRHLWRDLAYRKTLCDLISTYFSYTKSTMCAGASCLMFYAAWLIIDLVWKSCWWFWWVGWGDVASIVVVWFVVPTWVKIPCRPFRHTVFSTVNRRLE